MTGELAGPRLVVHTESTGINPLNGLHRNAVNAIRFLADAAGLAEVRSVPESGPEVWW